MPRQRRARSGLGLPLLVALIALNELRGVAIVLGILKVWNG